MEELLQLIVKNIVNHVDQIKIERLENDKNIVFNLIVEKDDIGKLIGKNGKTIRSIRKIVKSGAFNTKKQVLVEVVE